MEYRMTKENIAIVILLSLWVIVLPGLVHFGHKYQDIKENLQLSQLQLTKVSAEVARLSAVQMAAKEVIPVISTKQVKAARLDISSMDAKTSCTPKKVNQPQIKSTSINNSSVEKSIPQATKIAKQPSVVDTSKSDLIQPADLDHAMALEVVEDNDQEPLLFPEHTVTVSKTTPIIAPKQTVSWYIQIGSFAQLDTAQQWAIRLKKEEARVQTVVNAHGQPMSKVWVPLKKGKTQAQAMRNHLFTKYGIKGFLTRG